MNCEEFAEMVTDLLQRQPVDEEKRMRALTHARVCSTCSLRMEQEQALTVQLRALARAMAPEEAPVWIEERVLSQFRKRTPSTDRPPRRSWLTASGAIAAGLVLLILSAYFVMLNSPQPEQIHTRTRAIENQGSAPPGRGSSTLRRLVVTDFIPLVDASSMGASERGHLLRVRLDRTALLWIGLPMNEDLAESSILADVLIGDDGLARAVRFVR